MIVKNRKASFDYHFVETFEAGIALEGWEVKAIREGSISLAESYIDVSKGKARLQGAHITPLKQTSTHSVPEPTRNRALLLKKHEIEKLQSKVAEKGLTVVPVSMYWKKNKLKLEIALAKGKNTVDKRNSLKDKAVKRDEARTLKSLKI